MMKRLVTLLFLHTLICIIPIYIMHINILPCFGETITQQETTPTVSTQIPTLKINSINFDNSDSIIFLGTSGGSENPDGLKITKKILSEPDRVFFDIENAVITFPNSTYELKNSRLTKLRIAQNTVNPNVVRIVIWKSQNYDTSQIKILRIKNNIIIKLSSETPLQQYLTQVYKETSTSSVDIYDKAVAIPEEKPQIQISDEIFNQVQQAFKNDDNELVRPNIEQKQARLKSRFFLEDVGIKNGNILISGIGVINVEKPFKLTEPSRIVFDLPNTIVLQDLRNKEIKLNENETVKIGQLEPSKARIVIKTPTPDAYRPIYSSNLQTLLIANENRLMGLNLTHTLSELAYFKEQNVNTSTNLINIIFSRPIVYSLKREPGSINMTIYNLANFNTTSFNQLAINNKTGFIAKQLSANIYKISFPVKEGTLVDCYETLNASQLRFVFTTRQIIITEKQEPKQEPKEEQVRPKSEVTPIKIDEQELRKQAKIKKKEKLLKNKIKNKVIIIDPGHGGNDTGAMRGNVEEKDLTLSIALKVQEELNDMGFKNVIMTRSTDKTLSLSERVDIANNNNADIFVSIHINSSVKSEINGIETHYYSDNGYNVAKMLHKELIENISTTDRGLFKSKFYVINHTEAPAVLLELGFISNEQERSMLTSKRRQNASAKAIAEGIYNYLAEQ